MAPRLSAQDGNDKAAGLFAEKVVTTTNRLPAEKLVGERVREIRTQKDLTLDRLAERSKLDIHVLSMIEEGKTSPPIGTLQRIAKALDVPINVFFQSGELLGSVTFTAYDKRPEATCCQALIQNLGKDLKNATLEPFVVTLHKDACSGGRNLIHSGFEFAYCLSGKILYFINEIEYPMAPGDSLTFSALLPHRWENIHTEKSQFILVLTPGKQSEEQGKVHFQSDEGK